MVRPIVFAAAATAFFGEFAFARNCTQDLYYCGITLLGIRSDYRQQIDDALGAGGLDNSNNTIVSQTLFDCVDGDNGDLKVSTFCENGCIDGGSGHSDYCNGKSTESTATSTSAASTTTAASTSTSATSAVTGSTSNEAASQETSSSSDSGSGTPVGAIAGGVVGGVAALGLVGAVAFWLGRRKSKAPKGETESTVVSPGWMPPAELHRETKPVSPTPEHSVVHEAPNYSDARHEMA